MSNDIRILVVNDEPVVLKAQSRLVRSLCDELLTAETGKEAFRIVAESRPDVILLDRVLPDIDGTEVCRRIKADPATQYIYVAIVSASQITSEQQAEGLDTGADDYLVWPMGNREFTARVKAMLRIQQSERALRASREQYRRIVETALEGVWLVDQEGRTTFVNGRMAEMLGYTVPEMVGRAFTDFVADGAMELALSQLMRCRENNKPRQDLCFRRKDGALLWSIVSSTPLRGQDGQPGACLTMVMDITERKSVEEEREKLIGELQESLQKIKKLSNLLPVCMSCKKIRDDSGYWNDLEQYLLDHGDIVVSHGLCPDCAQKLYPDYFDESDFEKE